MATAVPAGILLLLAVLPASAAFTDGCSCNPTTSDSAASAVLRLKLAAIATILIAGSAGVCLPIAGRTLTALRPDRDAFFSVKSLAAGVILGTAMVHILPEAFRSLASPCLGDSLLRKFPFAGFVSMMSAIGTMVVDSLATGYYRRSALSKPRPVDELETVVEAAGVPSVHDDDIGGHEHSHGLVIVTGEEGGAAGPSAAELLRSRVVSQVLELGIVVHSVVIGITLGTSKNLYTVKPLVAALSFHQFFEGLGLGGCIVQARFKVKSMVVMAVFFSLTTPIGVAVGIALSAKIDGRSSAALAVEGIFNAASAGILIYMALVDLLAADHMNPRMQSSWKLQLWANASLLVGVGCMSLMAKWS